MPAATGGQSDLEASLLLALNTVAKRARAHGDAGGGLVVRRIRLLSRALWLEVREEAVGRLLAATLPALGAAGFDGIPGLRPHPGRDHLDLRVVGIDGRPNGLVRLVGVDRKGWSAAVRHIEAATAAGDPLWLDHRDGLHETELAALCSVATAPTDLMSAVLRRYPLWRRAAWVDSMIEGDSLRVRWQNGPRAAVVAAILTDSACRIPGVSVARVSLSEAMQSVILSFAEMTKVSEDPDWAWAELQAVGIRHTASMPPLDRTGIPCSPVTPEVWEQAEMREALFKREIGAVYRLLRRHGVSLRQIAALTGQTQSEVSDILRGRQVLEMNVLARIAQGLGVPRGYMALAYDEALPSHAAEIIVEQLSEEDEAQARQRFLVHAASITSGLMATGPTSYWSAPSAKYDDLPEVRQVEEGVELLRSSAGIGGGDRVRGLALAHLWVAKQLRGTPEGEAGKERLDRALARLEELARPAADTLDLR